MTNDVTLSVRLNTSFTIWEPRLNRDWVFDGIRVANSIKLNGMKKPFLFCVLLRQEQTTKQSASAASKQAMVAAGEQKETNGIWRKERKEGKKRKKKKEGSKEADLSFFLSFTFSCWLLRADRWKGERRLILAQGTQATVRVGFFKKLLARHPSEKCKYYYLSWFELGYCLEHQH